MIVYTATVLLLRVVNVSSLLGNSAVNKCSPELKVRLTSRDISMAELEKLMNDFEEDVLSDTYQGSWPQTAYGVSKIGVTTMSIIQQRQMDAAGMNDVIVNACCPGWCRTDLGGPNAKKSASEGADTPVYLATLPENTTSPRGELLHNRNIKKWLRSGITS